MLILSTMLSSTRCKLCRSHNQDLAPMRKEIKLLGSVMAKSFFKPDYENNLYRNRRSRMEECFFLQNKACYGNIRGGLNITSSLLVLKDFVFNGIVKGANSCAEQLQSFKRDRKHAHA
ncbi:unnamed protein product [Lepeophtheirus salmonis]|uniref:(salmon louse) hypothetical protein n=1 Tax=Lepeophtheirus salmonis TaxID=72036 RepID=A0A7R8CTV7_LEPSM|nr:unnamed protein product [Lepeophtheirus salmonis]CAF2928573.1 unnamed protein product [Lepeophtheirus salmonis]